MKPNSIKLVMIHIIVSLFQENSYNYKIWCSNTGRYINVKNLLVPTMMSVKVEIYATNN